MNYIFQFDVAALIIDAILIFFHYQKRNIPSLQNQLFLWILYGQFFCTFFDLAIAFLEQYYATIPLWIIWAVECTSYTLLNTFGLLFAMYCMAYLNIWKKVSRKVSLIIKAHFIIPAIIILLLIWFSPVLADTYPLIFTIDKINGYQRCDNFWYYFLYSINAYYIIFAFITLGLNRKYVPAGIRRLLYFYVSLVFVGVIIQMYCYGLLLTCFAISLASLIFFFYVQKPEEVLDSITGAFNQTGFIKMTEHYFEKDNKFTCISILLDDTIFMSNTFGINQMNNFMTEVKNFLVKEFSFSDVFCLNQSCFCIIIKNPNDSILSNTMNKILMRFQSTWTCNAVELKFYSRVCVIECPYDAQSPEEILDIINMVSTDERYKQNVIFAKEIDMEYKRRTMYIEHSLRNGLTENRFDVYYQPIYSTSEKTIIGAEALIRLKDEKGRFISPEDFIPIAEKTGTILRIGEYVFETVCRNLSRIDLEEYGIKKVDINLSVAQCMQEILAEQILTINSIYRIPPEIINLEITETAAAHTPEILLKNMQNLANAGFELSLDDYGSGYSNMNYMLNLPFKMIKIDKYIVWAAFSDERAELALASTIKMIKSLGMTVLAEGVEEKDQAEWLIDLGCDYLQGFYYSKPVPKDEFLDIMKKNKAGEK